MVSIAASGAFGRSSLIQSLQTVYRMTDKDGDGFVSRSEFSAKSHISGRYSIHDDDKFDKMDKNGDGKLSEMEYVIGMLYSIMADIPPWDEEEKEARIRRESATSLYLIQKLENDKTGTLPGTQDIST